jgi:SAM-dependent methyltransferase
MDYIHYALTLNESLLSQNPNVHFKVLISDTKSDLSAVTAYYPNIEFYFVDQLCEDGIAKVIYEKYAATEMDCFRWSIKPVFICFLLDQNYEQVFYLDCDLHFFASFDFLSNDLDGNGVLLTPHWRSSSPQKDKVNFSILQTSGLFNAGFVGVSKHGRPAMEWWASACVYKCKKAPSEGLFVDQAYLDLLPVYFDNIRIERHRGCNIASWNQIECERIPYGNGEVGIKGGYEIVFIHFTKSTIDAIKFGKDFLLRSYLDKYQKALGSYSDWVKHSTDIRCNKENLTAIQNKKAQKFQHNHLPVSDLSLNPTLSSGNLDTYFARHSILNALKSRINDFEGKLLDVGYGQMPYKQLLTSNPNRVLQYISLNLDGSRIHDNQPDITMQDGKIPLAEGSIDCAIATEVFEHCPDPTAVMREICRVLRPGGLVFFTVPFLWPLHKVPYDKCRYTPFSLRRHLAASGFVDIEQEPLGGWDASLAQALGLWVRQRSMHNWARKILSGLLMPIIFMLHKKDEQVVAKFHESAMITGLSGTARKPGDGV